MSTLYMKGDTHTIAPYVIFSGDPWRVDVLSKYLENVKHVAFAREFNTYTGSSLFVISYTQIIYSVKS